MASRDAPVEPHAQAGRHLGAQRLLNERMRELETVDDAGNLDHQPRGHGLGDEVQDLRLVQIGDLHEHGDVEGAADHRRHLEQLVCRIRQARQALADDLTNAFGKREPCRGVLGARCRRRAHLPLVLVEVTDHLQARRTGFRRSLRPAPPPAARRRGRAGRRRRSRPGSRPALRADRRATAARPTVSRRRSANTSESGCVRESSTSRYVPSTSTRAGRRSRASARSKLKLGLSAQCRSSRMSTTGADAETAASQRITASTNSARSISGSDARRGVSVRELFGQARNDPTDERSRRAELRAQLAIGCLRDKMSQRLGERFERNAKFLVATARQHNRAVCVSSPRELRDQSRLADSRLTAHERDAHAAIDRLVPRRGEALRARRSGRPTRHRYSVAAAAAAERSSGPAASQRTAHTVDRIRQTFQRQFAARREHVAGPTA